MRLPEPLASELRRFLDLQLARGLTPHTVRACEIALNELVVSATRRGKHDLRELDPADVLAYLNELAAEGRAESTIRGRLYSLQHLFAFLQSAGVVLIDPTARLHRRYVPEKMRAWLTEDETCKLLDAVRTKKRCFEVRNRAILEVLYSSGLRAGELFRLELNDLDLAEGFLTVRQSKSGEGRVVPLGREASSWLKRYLKEVRRRLVNKNRNGRDASPLVFLSGQGKPMRWNEINQPLAIYAERAGIQKRVSAHVLRHSFAMHLLKNGAPTRYIQLMLGHRQLLSTQRYTRLMPLGLREAHARAHPRGRMQELPKE